MGTVLSPCLHSKLRFPSDFMFELTKEEYDALRCKNFTSNARGGNRYLPFAFTREGIAMLSGLLRSEIAVQANISIMRAFFQMQEALPIVSNTQLTNLSLPWGKGNHFIRNLIYLPL